MKTARLILTASVLLSLAFNAAAKPAVNVQTLPPIDSILPPQKGKAGQVLKTDGAHADWAHAASLQVKTRAGSFALSLDDLNALAAIDADTACTWTIPADSEAAFPVGSSVYGAVLGAGRVTVAGAQGVTVVTLGGLTAAGRGATWQAIKVGPNRWLVTGQLIASASNAEIGQTILLTAVSDGTEPKTYAWAKDGQTIAGATEAQLVLANVQSSASGAYVVTVSNASGAKSSDPELIVVGPSSAQ